MKNKLRNIIYIGITLLILIGCSSEKCSSENEGLCELENITEFIVEDQAKINLAVFNDGFGNDIVESFNLAYPDQEGLLTYEVISAESNEETLNQWSNYDLIQVKSDEAPLYFNKIIAFDESFSSILENENTSKFSSQINQAGNYFMPFDVEGLLFAYNKTMLEAFDVDLSDGNNDGLPEAIDSFEKIVDLSNQWRKDQVTYLDQTPEEIFSFPLNDQLAMLAFFQNSDYRLIGGSSAEMLDLDSNLLTALETLKSLGENKWRFDESLDNDFSWNYEEVLINQSAPFLLAGNWMYYDHYQKSKAYEQVFAKLPSLNNSDLTTLSSVSGFVLNKASKYPDAANMVLKHIKGVQGSQVAISNGIVPLINQELLKVEGFNVNKNTKEMIKAYQYSETSPLQAFEQKPEKRGWDIYLENDFREVIKGVFLNEIEPEVAQSKIKEIIVEWLDFEDISVEGLNDKQLETDN